jgi:hypothetical protein
VQTKLNAIVTREIAACLSAGNDVVCAECVAGVGKGNGQHGRTAVLEGANHAAEGRYDKSVERSRKVFLSSRRENGVNYANRIGRQQQTDTGDPDAKICEASCIRQHTFRHVFRA